MRRRKWRALAWTAALGAAFALATLLDLGWAPGGSRRPPDEIAWASRVPGMLELFDGRGGEALPGGVPAPKM